MPTEMEKLDSFIAWVEKERAERGWSIRKLAKEAGVSHAAISNFLNRYNQPGMRVLKGIAEAFDRPEVTVLRKAGKLPPVDEDRELYEELRHALRHATFREKLRVVRTVKALLREPDDLEEEELPDEPNEP